MKAIRVREFGPPEVMRLEEIPDLHPDAKQVVLRVKAAGVNPVDTYVRSGARSPGPLLPYTPGSDASGVVEAVGEGLTGVRVGTRAYISGTLTGSYAEQSLCLETQIHPLPDNISFSQGAGIHIPYGTAYRALFQRARAKPGDIVLVHGATGGVGIAATQWAVAAGMTVIGTGGTENGRNLVMLQGAQYVLDHRASDHLGEIPALTGGRGVDVVLEMLANVNLDRDLKILARGGRIVVIGSRGRVEIDPRDAMPRDASILGMMLGNASESELAGIHSAIAAGLKNCALRPVVGQEIPLAEAPRAHRQILEPGAFGKIVLIP